MLWAAVGCWLNLILWIVSFASKFIFSLMSSGKRRCYSRDVVIKKYLPIIICSSSCGVTSCLQSVWKEESQSNTRLRWSRMKMSSVFSLKTLRWSNVMNTVEEETLSGDSGFIVKSSDSNWCNLCHSLYPLLSESQIRPNESVQQLSCFHMFRKGNHM